MNAAAPDMLFANYSVPNCGVYHYGKNLVSVLRGSERMKFHYADVETLPQLDEAVRGRAYAVVLVNYHPFTLSFARPDAPRRYQIPVVAVMHEMTQAEVDTMPRCLFQYYVMGDPTLRESAYVFSTGRIIENGIRPYQHLLDEWSPAKIRSRYEEIMKQVLARGVEVDDSVGTAAGRAPSGRTSWGRSPLRRPQGQTGVIEAVAMIPPAFRLPETYLVTLATYVHNQFVIDLASDCFSFVVQDGGSKYAASEGVDYGCVFAPCNWSVGYASESIDASNVAS